MPPPSRSGGTTPLHPNPNTTTTTTTTASREDVSFSSSDPPPSNSNSMKRRTKAPPTASASSSYSYSTGGYGRSSSSFGEPIDLYYGGGGGSSLAPSAAAAFRRGIAHGTSVEMMESSSGGGGGSPSLFSAASSSSSANGECGGFGTGRGGAVFPLSPPPSATMNGGRNRRGGGRRSLAFLAAVVLLASGIIVLGVDRRQTALESIKLSSGGGGGAAAVHSVQSAIKYGVLEQKETTAATKKKGTKFGFGRKKKGGAADFGFAPADGGGESGDDEEEGIITPEKVAEWNSMLRFPPSDDPQRGKANRPTSASEVLDEAESVLRWAASAFPPNGDSGRKLIQVTSFGPSGMVLLDLLRKFDLLQDIVVVTVDTLHLFPETYALIDKAKKTYPEMTLHVYRPKGFTETLSPEANRAKFDDKYGVNLWRTNPERYGQLSKVEPLQRALDESDAGAWITGRRRSQGGERADIELIELDMGHGDDSDGGKTEGKGEGKEENPPRVKINPLASWSYDQVWDYLRTNAVPYNPLHDTGYKSIGDTMTSLPVGPNDPERSGRFRGMNRTECGIHSHLKKVKKLKDDAKREGKEFIAPRVPCRECVDLNNDNFDDAILRGLMPGKLRGARKKVAEEGGTPPDILLEFYSPYCGACQDWGPHFASLAAKLKRAVPDRLAVARFDITEHPVPESGKQLGMDVESTPAMYLILRKPKLEAIFYDGEHIGGDGGVREVLEFLEDETGYVQAKELMAMN